MEVSGLRIIKQLNEATLMLKLMYHVETLCCGRKEERSHEHVRRRQRRGITRCERCQRHINGTTNKNGRRRNFSPTGERPSIQFQAPGIDGIWMRLDPLGPRFGSAL